MQFSTIYRNNLLRKRKTKKQISYTDNIDVFVLKCSTEKVKISFIHHQNKLVKNTVCYVAPNDSLDLSNSQLLKFN